MRIKTVLLIVLFQLIGLTLFGQETNSKISLKKILSTIESNFDYKFNYLENTIEGINLEPPRPDSSINEILAYLESETHLEFKFIDDIIISIQPKKLAICGYLKDKETQEAISFATIQGANTSVITNEKGYFQLELSNSNNEIMIRHLGYKTLILKTSDFNMDNCLDVFIVQDAETLGQVILSNYLVEGINKLNNGDLEIDFSKFNILPGLIETDVLQSVQAFPGIQSINETISNINIRGGSHDQNLILWDDIKMYQTGHFFGLISVFNPQMTEKVTLNKNGTSPDYSDGVSGMIAMETGDSVNKEFNGSLGLNLIDVNGFIDVPVGEKSSFQLGARKSLSDFVDTPTYNQYFERISQDTEVENSDDFIFNSDKEFDFYDISLRWLYQPSDRDILRVNFITINNELVFNENTEIGVESRSRESSVSQNSLGAGLNYKRTWTNKLSTTFQIYETDYKLKAINANLLDAQRFLQENKVSETGVRLNFDYVFNNTITLQSGYQFIESEITNLDDVDNPLIRTLISDVVRTHSGFAQMNFQSLDLNTNLNLGFRYNFLDKFSKHIYEPRISFHQRFLEHFGIEISGEVKHQTSSQIINFQNDFLGVEKRRWQMSNNEDIPVLISNQVALGLNFSNRGWLINIEGYYKYVDGITTQSQGFQNQYEFVKTSGSYEVVGLDFLIRKRFKNANVWVSYSTMDNTYTFKELPEITFPSNFDINHAVTVGLTYRYKSLKFSSGLNWNSGKPTTRPVVQEDIVNENINYSLSNSSRLDDYLRLDASLLNEFKIGNTELHVGVSIWNILDRENEINNYYRINSNGDVEEFIQQALGFTPNAKLRLYF